MPEPRRNVVAFISSYIPRHCGIATFTNDLATAIAVNTYDEPLDGNGNVHIVALNDRPQGYSYGPEVRLEIQQHVREDYRNAAEILNTSKIDVVSLQHEFGLFGGEYGEYVIELVDRLKIPLVSTLHTILADLPQKKLDILRHICEKSTTVVVMAERAETILNEQYGVPRDRIRMIPHGVPDVAFRETEPFKDRFHLGGRPTILTFGLLSPPKGIEFMLDALAKVVPEHPDVAYVILGATHPAVKRESGESYRLSLETRAVDLGIQKNVVFHNRYVSNPDLIEYLQAADIYVTPYPLKEQITSGSLAYALACGKAIVSTSYWHAQELLADGRGILVEPGDVEGLAAAIRELLSDRDKYAKLRKAAYEARGPMLWPPVGHRHAEVLEEARQSFAEARREVPAERKVLMRLSLPDVRLDHFLNMTDDTGLLRNAIFATPDRRQGYCTDDNARALIVSAMAWSLFQDERVLPCMQVYLSFLHHAETIDGGRFRNFLSYDRRWLEPNGSDDCQGRVAWALGHLVAHAPNLPARQLAEHLFRGVLPAIAAITSPRPWAFAILGLHYYLRIHQDQETARDLLEDLANRLDGVFSKYKSEDWPWYEDQITYDNGRLPQALIIAGFMLDRKDLIERGLSVLRWLLAVQTTDRGHLSVIGDDGWFRRGVQRPVFNQQPVEPASLIGACKAAHRVSGDPAWLHEMRRCFEWYLGRNDLGTAMVDFRTWGCYDSLKQTGLNFNQGGEAAVSWLLSLLIMHEMQTGDPPMVG
jgi:glycosyltransferase involved in cell wall biosynthesis